MLIIQAMKFTDNDYSKAFNLDYETFILLKHNDAVMNY